MKNKMKTIIALTITIILHYYYGMKYSNSNGFLKCNS